MDIKQAIIWRNENRVYLSFFDLPQARLCPFDYLNKLQAASVSLV